MNNSTLEQSLKRYRNRLDELSKWKDLACRQLEGGWFWSCRETEKVSIHVGDAWPECDLPVHFRFTAVVPVSWAGMTIHLHLDVGGEGLLYVDGKILGGLNPHHREYQLLDQASGGEVLYLEVEAVPRDLFGVPETAPRLNEARLVVPDDQVRALYEDLSSTLAAAEHLSRAGSKDVAWLLADALGETLRHLALPRNPTEAYLARLLSGDGEALPSTWEEWRFEAPPLPLPEELRGELASVGHVLTEHLDVIRSRYPAEGALHLTGHTHIDVAWLWPLAETRRKVKRAFATVIDLMNRYPELQFNQSSAQLYAYVERDAPELFEKIRECIKEGRWEPIGGMWVEPDGNLPAGEAWARHLLYGQHYFENRFGRRSQVAWLPDTFGYAGNLPQLFRLAGLPYFSTTKLNWNETNPFPYDLYWWEGIDGSRVLAHTFRNPHGYNGRIEAHDLEETWRRYRGKRRHPVSLYAFGYGDGGGGPTAGMLERYRRYRDFPGLPRLDMGSVEAFFKTLPQEELPVWVGEQYLELHRGTYSTQGRIKRLNRQLEHVVVEAEAVATVASLTTGSSYPTDVLQQIWMTLLRNQFHDILPGSSIRTVNEEAEVELGDALHAATEIRDEVLMKMSRLVDPGERATLTLVAWNITLEDRPLRLETGRPLEEPFRLVLADGREVPYQDIGGGRIVLSSGDVEVPGLGYLALAVLPGSPRSAVEPQVSVQENVLENEELRVEVAGDGTLRSIYDKAAGREVLADRANQIWLYPDLPREWEAWDVDVSYRGEGVEVLAAEPLVVEEAGPLRASLRVVRRVDGGEIHQVYRLFAGSRCLRVRTRILWNRRRTLVRTLFPLTVRSHEASFETTFGAVARPTHRNTSWDAARFEVPAHRWADLSEAGYGVSLLNDGRYGHSVEGNRLGLTLLRSPVYPDPFADEGEHSFTYALYPHAGDWRLGTVRAAHDLNAPLTAVTAPVEEGVWSAEGRFITLPDRTREALRLACLKQSEDGEGVLLRLYEAHGGRGRSELATGLPLEACHQADLLEIPGHAVPLRDGKLHLDYAPYQVISLRFGFKS